MYSVEYIYNISILSFIMILYDILLFFGVNDNNH